MLAAIHEASVMQRSETGAPLRRIGATMRLEPGTLVGAERRAHGGFDLHAGVVVRAADRQRLEHLCRYLLRPPLANDRLELVQRVDLSVLTTDLARQALDPDDSRRTFDGQSSKALPPELVALLGIQLGEALAYAHEDERPAIPLAVVPSSFG